MPGAVQSIAQIFWTGLAMAVPIGLYPSANTVDRNAAVQPIERCPAGSPREGRSLSQWRTFATLIGTCDFR